ncbi:VOC family protein [Zwartia vadi]|uniref:VOC family protein n=1 Tax=Zwartia vadi TaxID=3058168 RepID=UPI0025B36CD6|nr:VOC family protein [Zwartia vadi]MDN3986988.1 VOC family protein [Zwartia vadi]
MIERLDHFVLTTSREKACIDFYTRVLGMHLENFVAGSPPIQRKAFKFGNQKINLHVQGAELSPRAHLPVPGALDLCFIVTDTLDSVIEKINHANWEILEGPVQRTGAIGKIRSIYLRDPDLNLIELSELI